MEIQKIILGLLQANPMTGYELKQMFDTSLRFCSGASFGSIYPVLKKLEAAGLVSMELMVQDGKPNRKVYSITPAGKEAFAESLLEKLNVPPFRNEFITKAFFCSSVGQKRCEKLAEEYLQILATRREDLEQAGEVIQKGANVYQKLCYRFGQRLIKHFEENTRQFIEELKEELKDK